MLYPATAQVDNSEARWAAVLKLWPIQGREVDEDPDPDGDLSPEPDYSDGAAEIVALICSYPWDCREALAVVACESNFDHYALGGNNYGLFQINAIHRRLVDGDLSQLFIPEVNVAVAWQLYSERGWQPWACAPAAAR